MENDSSDVIFAGSSRSWNISLSGNKGGPFCITGSQYDRELSVVDPPTLPIDLWLGSRKPGIPHDCLLFS